MNRPAKPYPKHAQLASERKQYRRKVASRKTWAKIVDEKIGPCRVCCDPCSNGSKFGHIEFHHIVPRGWGGDDIADNIVPVCDVCHGALTNRHPPHCREFVLRLTDAEYAYAVARGGEQIWERVYGIEYSRV